MKITVVGAGYAGLCTAVGFAVRGHDVVCVDINQERVDKVNNGVPPIFEHNLDVIKSADHIIDLGPEGGDAGGRIIAEGAPEDVAATKGSHTGEFLREILKKRPQRVAVVK